MDSITSSLFPINQIGADGFQWWIGQIESPRVYNPETKQGDPKRSGRYKVRIVGEHLKSCDITPSSELPWAQVMMPVTTPWSDGGVTGVSIGLDVGSWVIGFWLDPEKTKPIIMGSIGHTAGATLLSNVENDPNPGGTCKSFTTYLNPKRDPYMHSGIPLEEGEGEETTEGATKPGEAGLPAIAANQPTSAFLETKSPNGPTTPKGTKICVEIANPKCKSDSDFKNKVQNILKEALYANQNSGGRLGDYYVGKLNGALFPVESEQRKYVNKIVRLSNLSVGRAKGEILKYVKLGVEEVIKWALYSDPNKAKEKAEKAADDTTGGAVDPKLDPKQQTPDKKLPKVSRLKPIIDIINEVLDDLGCELTDFTKRLQDWLVDYLMRAFKEIFQASLCAIDQIVESILSYIVNGIQEILERILGPLEAIVGKIAGAINIVGGAINRLFSFLGIKCDGPKSICVKKKKVCTDCDQDKDDKNWLDDLIDFLADGPVEGRYYCDESKETPNAQPTKVFTTGGLFAAPVNPPGATNLLNTISYSCSDITVVEGDIATFTIVRSGNTNFASSIKYTFRDLTATKGVDYIKEGNEGGTIAFGPNVTEQYIRFRTFADDINDPNEEFRVDFIDGVTPDGLRSRFPNGRSAICTIIDKSSDDLPTSGGITPGPGSPTPPFEGVIPFSFGNNVTIPTPPTDNTIDTTTIDIPVLNVSSDQDSYIEGETAIFTITTRNVVGGSVYNYTIAGVDADDITGGELTGTFTIENGQAVVPIQIAVNDDVNITQDVEVPRFDVNGDYVKKNYQITEAVFDGETIVFTTLVDHEIVAGDTASVEGLSNSLFNNVFEVDSVTSNTFTVTPDTTENDPITVTGDTASVVDAGFIFDIETRVVDSVDPSETLVFSVDNTDASTSVIILGDEESGLVSYSVRSDKPNYDEGETMIFTIKTKNVEDNTVIDWRLSGDNIERTDFAGNTFTGEVTIVDNTGVVEIGVARDTELSEPSKFVGFNLGTPVVASTSVILNANVIEDDADDILPTSILIDTDKLEYNEGETIEYTVTTLNIPDGTQFTYNLFGLGITTSDFVNGELSGTFVVYDNTAKIYVGIEDDLEQEEDETLTLNIDGTGAAASVVILASDQPDRDEDPGNVSEPCLRLPTFGDPITDSSGSIISIPVVDPGCPFEREPKVIITGRGYGAGAIALLDPRGFLTEVRVTSPGVGYVENVAEQSGLNCIIDSFTLLRVGRGYTSVPNVYVNGELGVAEAEINDNGYVVSVKILDRTKTYSRLPDVTISGGNGAGAVVIPSLACLDSEELVTVGSVKIGTGRYIDCP